MVLFQDWPVFWKKLLLDSVWKILCALQYVIMYLALLCLVNGKKENIYKGLVSFIMAKQVNIEVILLKSLRDLLKKPDTTI